MATKKSPPTKRDVDRLEKQIQKDKRRLVLLRQQLRPWPVADYEFTTGGGKKIKLSRLFGKSDELILIHNMGTRCPYCTMWADGFNGLYPHLADRCAFAVVSPDPPMVMREFARGRHWRFPIYSHAGTSFGKDLDFEGDQGAPWPGVSTFFKNPDGRIYRVAYTYFGPGDDFCAVWPLFDLLARGASKWAPKFSYR